MVFTFGIYNYLLGHFKVKDPVIFNLILHAGFIPAPSYKNVYSQLISTIMGQGVKSSVANKQRYFLYNRLGKDNFTPVDIDNLSPNFLVSIGVKNPRLDLIYDVTTFII